jgi:hypothetical protein
VTPQENLDSVLTNSKKLIPSFNNPFDMDTDTPINVGIDKVHVGCILQPPYYRDSQDLDWDSKGGSTSWPLIGNEKVYLYTNVINGVHRGYMTFNPAKIIDPCGITCASWTETLEVIARVARIVHEQFFIFEPTTYGLSIYSLHLTADFSPIPDMQRVMKKAMTLRAFRGKKPHAYFAPNGIDIQTVYFCSESRGKIRIYDKSVEAGLAVPTLRIEYETVRKLHKAEGTPLVGDITDETIQRLFRKRLEPVIKALNPTHERFVDQIIANRTDLKRLIQICGIEFLNRLGIYPPLSQSIKDNRRDFDKKYFYTQIEDIL